MTLRSDNWILLWVLLTWCIHLPKLELFHLKPNRANVNIYNAMTQYFQFHFSLDISYTYTHTQKKNKLNSQRKKCCCRIWLILMFMLFCAQCELLINISDSIESAPQTESWKILRINRLIFELTLLKGLVQYTLVKVI